MPRISLRVLCFSAALVAYGLAATSACSQEYDFPVLNSMGRFLGVGYSRHGYHSAADGRPNIVTRIHAPQKYASGQLMYPYSPGYQPVSTTYQMAPTMSHFHSQPASTPPAAVANEETLPAPQEPPPVWLQPYLREKAAEPAESSGANPPQPPSEQEPFFLEEDQLPSPSDRNMEIGPDPLLLEETDTSARYNRYPQADQMLQRILRTARVNRYLPPAGLQNVR
ncbi:MAG: hypothetical protein KDB22_26305 [Planctomycetales bacterium]|nr:hypothetical protein [Planctomycetales bacterium]